MSGGIHLPSASSVAADQGTGGRDRHVRRPASIVFGDLVGYSLLMVRDETGTHSRWTRVLDEVIHPRARAAGGAVVQIMGDGFIAELPSPPAALGFAQAVQAEMLDAGVAGGGPPLLLRIALHCGEVTWTDGFLFGKAVNLAARLQEHAEPGGIVLSEPMHEALLQGGGVGPVRDLGMLALKNIEEPTRAFALGEAGAGAIPTLPAANSIPALAVLPFRNLGGDETDLYLADGLVEDIVVSLSGLRELLVIARGSTLGLRDPEQSAREIGKALGVRYLLRGTLRRAGARLRITTELCDAETGRVLLADRFDPEQGELFEVQDAITTRVATVVLPQIRRAEIERALRPRPGSYSAYDLMLRAIDTMEFLERDGFGRARAYLDDAIRRDPRFAMAFAHRARWHALQVGQGWSDDLASDRAACVADAARAVALDPTNALGLVHLAWARAFLYRDAAASLPQFDRALALCPNLARGWMLSSAAHAYLGHGAEAVSRARHAMRLSPLDPQRYQQSFFLGLAHYAAGEWQEALAWARRAADENRQYTAVPKLLAAALAASGRIAEAVDAACLLVEAEPGFRLGRYLETRSPFVDPDLAGAYAAHLRLARLPE